MNELPSFVAIAHDFPTHPKVMKLGNRTKRFTFIEVLCYCAEYRTRGVVPPEIRDAVPGANAAWLAKAQEVGLLDPMPLGGWKVHDWEEFNGTKAERQAARERKREERARKLVDNSHGNVATKSQTSHGPHARPPSPYPESTTTLTPTLDVPISNELATARLLEAVGGEDLNLLGQIRSLARRLPEGRILKVAESVTQNRPRNRGRYALKALQNEAT